MWYVLLHVLGCVYGSFKCGCVHSIVVHDKICVIHNRDVWIVLGCVLSWKIQ